MDKSKILLVDDDVDFVEAINIMLEKRGYHVITASSGKEGLKKAKSQNPDLILLDIMLPDKDGYSVCRQLTENPETGQIPVLILTAISNRKKDEKYADKIAFYHKANGFIEKPVMEDELLEKIDSLCGKKGIKISKPGEKKKILVVDDDLDFVSAVEKILKFNDFEIFVAENGVEALKMARTFLPEMVILDIMLPGKDGYTVCHELKKDPKTHNIPIILVSAISEELSRPEYATHIAVEHGANDYIDKPIAPEELLKKVKKYISQ